MKIFKEIFARIWALWAIIAFTVTMIFFLIPFMLLAYYKNDPEKTRRLIIGSRIWIDVFRFLIACPLRIKGTEHFREGEQYIVLCNHNSLMDVPLSSPYIPGGNKTIAKVEMSKIPLFGWIYQTGSVLVDRKNESSRKESFNKMKEVLEMGLHMCIYPEGTRNKTKEPMKAFQNGAFRLAVATGKPIIPAVIFHTRKVLPADKTFYCLPHRLAMHFLPPVMIKDGDTSDMLKERVFTIMTEYYLANQSTA